MWFSLSILGVSGKKSHGTCTPHTMMALAEPSSKIIYMCNFCCSISVGESGKKRKGTSPIPGDKAPSAKKKTPDEKKIQGFDRGLEPERILGKFLLRFFFLLLG